MACNFSNAQSNALAIGLNYFHSHNTFAIYRTGDVIGTRRTSLFLSIDRLFIKVARHAHLINPHE